MNVYKDWQLKREPFRDESDMANFARRHGYDEKKFMDTYKSFGVGLKAKNAIRLVNALGSAAVFDGVPTVIVNGKYKVISCLLYTSPSPRDGLLSRMPSSA